MPLEDALGQPRGTPLACCSGMAYYSSNAPSITSGTTRHASRFDDPECLIHVAEDGQVGIILHDGSGRYSIIKFCPWCGQGVGPEADVARAAHIAELERLGIDPDAMTVAGRRSAEIPRGIDPMTEGNVTNYALLDDPPGEGRPLVAGMDAVHFPRQPTHHMTPGEQHVMKTALRHSTRPAISHKKKTSALAKAALKPGKVWTEDERREASVKAKAAHAERKRRQEAEARERVEAAHASLAPGQDEDGSGK